MKQAYRNYTRQNAILSWAVAGLLLPLLCALMYLAEVTR
jgi:hypothetical protein